MFSSSQPNTPLLQTGTLPMSASVRTTVRSPVPFSSAPVAGGGIGKGTIAKISPWTSPVPIYNPDTSYGRSYNPDHGEFAKVRMTEKRLANENPHGYQPTGDYKPKGAKFASSQKELYQFADRLTESLLRQPKSLAAFDPNRKLRLEPEEVKIKDSPLPKWSNPQRITRISQGNEEWLRKQEQRQLAKRLSGGEFIPTMNQLQLYGRREQRSKYSPHRFEQYGLWVTRDFLGNGRH